MAVASCGAAYGVVRPSFRLRECSGMTLDGLESNAMTIVDKIRNALRRKPLTDEDLAARAEAKIIREQMLQDRMSQRTPGGQNYRSGGR